LFFIIQISDIISFQPSNLDLIYKKAIQKAWLNGVQIKCIAIQWDIDGK
jgi:DNA-binding sugar fermentation-stimulating protein